MKFKAKTVKKSGNCKVLIGFFDKNNDGYGFIADVSKMESSFEVTFTQKNMYWVQKFTEEDESAN